MITVVRKYHDGSEGYAYFANRAAAERFLKLPPPSSKRMLRVISQEIVDP